ncbi:hypothetical protein D3C73_993390 [compost metagenome]
MGNQPQHLNAGVQQVFRTAEQAGQHTEQQAKDTADKKTDTRSAHADAQMMGQLTAHRESGKS